MTRAGAAPAAYPLLFAPLQSGRLRLRNRVVHAAMSTRMATAQKAGPRLVQYYANRARGGAAMVVTESLSVARHQRLPHKVRVWDPEGEAELSRWAEAVESHDCRLVGQVQDPGRGRHERGRNPDAIGPSPLPDDLSWTVPRELGRDEIRRMIDDFAESAARLERCGFSGVELSCGHGHLFHQFLSPHSNVRDDEWGGPLENRLRLIRDSVAAIRARCSSRFVLGLKLPGDDGVAGGIGPQEAVAVTRALADPAVIDYLCFTWGTHSHTLDLHVPDLHGARATFLPEIRALRRAAAGIPVVAVGLITDPAEAEGVLARGDAELVGLGRPLVTDPAWPAKAAAGREAEIRYCVSCNTCWGSITEGQPLVCDNNPRLADAREVDYWPEPATQRRRVVVVGGGIAGLEAAWTAAARGHDVTLFSRSVALGGSTRLHALLPGGEHLSSIYDWQQLAAKRAGVKLELGIAAGADDIVALRPDAVVLATGASMSWPASLPRSLQEEGAVLDLRTAVAELASLHERQSGTAVIVDQDGTQGTYDAAEFLLRLFDRVVVATPRAAIARDVPLVGALGIHRRFNHKRIRVETFVEVAGDSQWEEGRVSLRNVYNGDCIVVPDVALVAYATPRVPDASLARALAAHGIASHRIGDCRAPRGVLAATSEGHVVGHAL